MDRADATARASAPADGGPEPQRADPLRTGAADVEPLVGPPTAGRRFRGSQRVRLADTGPGGRLRLDAAARYLQDVANDDAHDSGIDNPAAWVVRRMVIDVLDGPRLRADLELVTFCSGLGACWAERRTSVRGDDGSRVEAAALWVQIDPHRGRPARLGPDFVATYGPSAGGRRVAARLTLGGPPPGSQDSRRLPFPVRQADLDVLGHVNNAVYWAMVEQAWPSAERPDGPVRVEVEHLTAAGAEAELQLLVEGRCLWVLDGDRVVAAARWRSLQPTSR
jgi:acyl-ACP thioesterase